jgi:hypothetical protein
LQNIANKSKKKNNKYVHFPLVQQNRTLQPRSGTFACASFLHHRIANHYWDAYLGYLAASRVVGFVSFHFCAEEYTHPS